MFVKPGTRQDDRDRPLVVRGPNKAILPEAGQDVPETMFWHRRLRDGDVIAAVPDTPPAAPDACPWALDPRDAATEAAP